MDLRNAGSIWLSARATTFGTVAEVLGFVNKVLGRSVTSLTFRSLRSFYAADVAYRGPADVAVRDDERADSFPGRVPPSWGDCHRVFVSAAPEILP